MSGNKHMPMVQAAVVLLLSSAVVLLSCGGRKPSAGQGSFTPELRAGALEYIAESMKRTVEAVGDSFPVATEKGVWEKDAGGWTGGYWAGMCWMMHDFTGDEYWLSQARRYTELLEPNRDDVNNIDVGILFWPSFVHGWISTGDPRYREIGLDGARAMMKRWIPDGGYFQNWGRLGDRARAGFVIIDCLINLDHLFWAFRETGDSAFVTAAASHARQTARAHVREDGSSWQVVEFDPDSGEKLHSLHKQGHSEQTTWSRGQSWGIYGFSRAYLKTGDPFFLETAVRMADWYIENLPEDFVPYWDFQAPGIPDDPRDSSAASMAASGLIELARQVSDPAKARKYRECAENTLASLTRKYLTRDIPGGAQGVLTGGTYFFEIGRGVNEASIWGDFYYLEAILRLGD